MSERIELKAVKSILSYLTGSEKRYAAIMFLLLILSSVLDVFGLASLIPVIMAASDPELITSNKYLGGIYHFFNFPSVKVFLLFLIAFVFLFFLLKNLFLVWINYKQVKFTAHVALNITKRQFTKYCNLPFWHFNNEGSARLINSVAGVPQYFVGGIIRPVFVLFSEVAIILVIVVGIFFYQPLLFLILALVLVPSGILTYQVLKKRSEKIGLELNALRPVTYSLINNTFNGFVELKLANKLGQFKGKFLKAQERTQALEAKSYLFAQIPIKVIEMVAILGVVTIYVYAVFSSDTANVVALIGLFAAAAYRLMPSVNRLLTSLVTLKQYEFSINELNQFKEFDLLSEESSALHSTVHFDNDIQFRNVSFSFPGTHKPTIQNINLTVKKGEKVGFIGKSGSGKTTLMNILLRFYQEDSGSVLIDGVPLTKTNLASWYKTVGYVKQDTFLMESSIKDNITLSDGWVDSERLANAIELASLKDFVDGLPDGVDTLLGEKGSRLSGGQKQRIGIARALYKNAKVLILDEATSALDSQTEREVSEAIDKLSHTDITILIIAHRVTTLRDCNRIFEMKEGRIVAERSYEEVLKEVI